MRRMMSSSRSFWPLLLVALCGAVAVLACSTSPFEQDTNTQLKEYQNSIRSEADWLWNNMNFCRVNLYPNDVYCQPETFKHPTVELSANERLEDPRAAVLLDQLDYAALLVQQAHDEWTRFCEHRSSASQTAAYLEQRLVNAYEYMNGVLVALKPSSVAPEPGST